MCELPSTHLVFQTAQSCGEHVVVDGGRSGTQQSDSLQRWSRQKIGGIERERQYVLRTSAARQEITQSHL